MDARVAIIWSVLLALAWAIWGPWLWYWLRPQRRARPVQAAAQESVAQQHSDAGLRLLHEKKWPEAIDAFDRALEVLQDHPRQEAALLFYRGFALEQMGKFEDAIADYEDCQAIYGRPHEEPQYVAAVRHGQLLAKLERHQEAEKHLRQAIAALQRGPQSLSWLQVAAIRVLVEMFNGAHDYARALESAQEGARVAHRLRDIAGQAGFLRAAGEPLRALGRPDEALRSYEQALDLYRRIGEMGGAARVTQDIAQLYQHEGKWDKALDWLQACLADEERQQNKHRQAQLCYDLACVHIDQGDLQDAGRLLQQSISLFRQTEDHQGIDQVGRTMMGLGILVHRRATANQMTFRDLERGSATSKKAKS